MIQEENKKIRKKFIVTEYAALNDMFTIYRTIFKWIYETTHFNGGEESIMQGHILARCQKN